MEDAYRELFGFLERLGETLDRLTEIAREKTLAVRKDDLLTVNECMKKEQAISLSLRAMDQKREKLLSGLGLKSIPLSALPEHCPEALRAEARSAAEELRNRYMIYRSAAEVSRTTLEVNLHQIEKLIADEAGMLPEGGAVADIRA